MNEDGACCVCRLYIVASGHGSPCLDLRRVSGDVADATVGADLGECGHTGDVHGSAARHVHAAGARSDDFTVRTDTVHLQPPWVA